MPKQAYILLSILIVFLTATAAQGKKPARLPQVQHTTQTPLQSKWDILNKAADLSYNNGDLLGAEASYTAALKEAEKLPEGDRRLAQTVYNLAVIYQIQDKYNDCQPLYERSLSLMEKSYGKESDRVAAVLDNLADVNRARGQLDEATDYYLKALKVYEVAYRQHPLKLAVPTRNLAEFYADRDELEKAESYFQKAIALNKSAGGDNHEVLAMALCDLGDFQCTNGRYDSAEETYKEALLSIGKCGSPKPVNHIRVLKNYAELHCDQGKFDMAESMFREALSIADKETNNQARADVPQITASLAESLDMQGKLDEADHTYKRAIVLLEDAKATSNLFACLKSYQKHLQMRNKKAEAEAVSKRIRDLRAKSN